MNAPGRGAAVRRHLARLALAAAALLAFAAFIALGTWQLERRAWKLDLIERVEQRVRAPAVPAPGPERWARLNAADDEYRRVQASGRFLHERETLVQASTVLGGGHWVLTPLQRDDGSVLLVNRGFVAPAQRDRASRSAREAGGRVNVTGLLRLSEPDGTRLQRNDPAAGRWYSRDVQAIARARGLGDVAPYFIDAEAGPAGSAGEGPVGGLTVVTFHNNHLVYALTWYALALMVLGAAWIVRRHGRRPGSDEGDRGGARD